MVDLLFLTDVSQVEDLQQRPGGWLAQARVVAGDLATAAALERLGVPFVDEWSFLTPDDISRNWHRAYDLATGWWDEALASTEHRGVPLAQVGRHDWIYPFEIALNARTLYDRLFA